jgi:hypothetical protein
LPRKRIALSMKAAPQIGVATGGKTSPGPNRPRNPVPPPKPPANDWFTDAMNKARKNN